MEKYIRVSDIKKVCDPYRDWDVPQLTADEVAGIVRCEDCKWRTENECRLLKERDPNTDHRIWRGFFCAYGEVV